MLKPAGNYMYHILQQSVTLHFVICEFLCLLVNTAIISLNSNKKLVFVMERCVISLKYGLNS
jgi:hypothetical protein